MNKSSNAIDKYYSNKKQNTNLYSHCDFVFNLSIALRSFIVLILENNYLATNELILHKISLKKKP